VIINGKATHCISAADRGLQYGDGLFETLAVVDGDPCCWDRHMARLRAGCRRLEIRPVDEDGLLSEVREEIGDRKRCVVKIILTRGEGGRGYRPAPDLVSTRAISSSPFPDYHVDLRQRGIRARICATRLGESPAVAGLKHLNRLEQVMARMEWDDDEIQEGLMLDTSGRVIEGTQSNLFLIKNGVIHTPDLGRCGIEGVVRGLVMDRARDQGMRVHVGDLDLEDLWEADGLFVTNSLIGLWPVREIDGRELQVGSIDAELIDSVMRDAFVHN
jgi:4-amino-4-deoxychorismate lyase